MRNVRHGRREGQEQLRSPEGKEERRIETIFELKWRNEGATAGTELERNSESVRLRKVCDPEK